MFKELSEAVVLMQEKYELAYGNWKQFSLNSPSEYQGLYAIYDCKDQCWFYCGKAGNIKKRFLSPRHPIHIAKSLDRKILLFCLEISTKLHGSETILIKHLQTLGNGRTCFDDFSPWYLPDGYREFHPHAVTAQGPWCAFENQKDLDSILEEYKTFLERVSLKS